MSHANIWGKEFQARKRQTPEAGICLFVEDQGNLLGGSMLVSKVENSRK